MCSASRPAEQRGTRFGRFVEDTGNTLGLSSRVLRARLVILRAVTRTLNINFVLRPSIPSAGVLEETCAEKYMGCLEI